MDADVQKHKSLYGGYTFPLRPASSLVTAYIAWILQTTSKACHTIHKHHSQEPCNEESIKGNVINSLGKSRRNKLNSTKNMIYFSFLSFSLVWLLSNEYQSVLSILFLDPVCSKELKGFLRERKGVIKINVITFSLCFTLVHYN